jgi:hypothetical protein
MVSQPISLAAKATSQPFRIKAKLDHMALEFMLVLLAICVCLAWSINNWYEHERLALIFSVPALMVSMWWLHSQLLAVARLLRFKAACLMDDKGLHHFSMGYLPWSTVHGVEIIEKLRDTDRSNDMQTFMLIGVSRGAFDRISPNFMASLALWRYANFNSSICAIELSCDFLDIESRRLLWHLRDRADRFGGARLQDWSGKETVEAAMRRRDRLAALKNRAPE